jgi:hypothetical protein
MDGPSYTRIIKFGKEQRLLNNYTFRESINLGVVVLSSHLGEACWEDGVRDLEYWARPVLLFHL